jgi:DNA-binding SARP family transcriptional activator/tetratricopeptide (TPR) repeat protein
MRFGVLGPLRIWDGSWLPVPRPQQRIVLAVLLSEAGRSVPAERLIDEVWGEEPPPAARRTLHGYVSRLRGTLGADGTLVGWRGGYELTVANGDVDSDVFGGLVASASQAAADGQPDVAAPQLASALALWRGPALADVPASPTVTASITRLEHARLDAAELWLALLSDLGRYADVAAEAERLIATHPLREPIWAQLMTALHRLGRRGEALDAYRRARDTLVAELGLEPGPRLQQLQAGILGGHPPTPVDASPTVGAQRAIDADRGTRGDPPRPGAAPLMQLPAAVAGFTGRRAEIERLDALFSPDRTTMVTISSIAGAAGVGKTALAVHFAHRSADRFPDGQLYVSLRGYTAGPPVRPIDALAGFLRALGVAAEQIPGDVDEAAALYRSRLAGKRMLILLDNANHPDQVRPLLPASPGCLVVVTSRDQLRGLSARDGAIPLTLDTLTRHEALTLLGVTLGPERVHAEPDAAAELVRLCGHLPLAVRIAAATLASRPAATIADYITDLAGADRLDGLEVDGDPEAGVRAAFERSYTILPDTARRLFRLLGPAPGTDISAESAAALVGSPTREARRQIERLVMAHLVVEHRPGRYTLHDLLRLYAIETCTAEDDTADRRTAIGRLLDHYLRRLHAAADHLHPQVVRAPLPPADEAPHRFDDDVSARVWLEAEGPNLVAATHYAAKHGFPETAWRLADALRGPLYLGGYMIALRAVSDVGLAAADAAGDPQGQAAAHLTIATLHWVQDHSDEAADHYRRALTLARTAGWTHGESAALGNLGGVSGSLGRLREAAHFYTEALAIERQTDRLAGQATFLVNLGILYFGLGQLNEAATHQVRALALYRRVRARTGEALTVATLGETLHALGRLDEALAILSEALVIHGTIHDRNSEIDTRRVIAAVHRDAGRHDDALADARAAVAIAQSLGARGDEAAALTTEASIHLYLGAHQDAVRGFQQALTLNRAIGRRYGEADALTGLGLAYLRAGDLREATHHADAGLALAHANEYRMLEGQARTALAAIRLGDGRPEEALVHAEAALAIHAETGHRLGQASTHLVLEQAQRRTGGTGAADRHHGCALDLCDEMAIPWQHHAQVLLIVR